MKHTLFFSIQFFFFLLVSCQKKQGQESGNIDTAHVSADSLVASPVIDLADTVIQDRLLTLNFKSVTRNKYMFSFETIPENRYRDYEKRAVLRRQNGIAPELYSFITKRGEIYTVHLKSGAKIKFQNQIKPRQRYRVNAYYPDLDLVCFTIERERKNLFFMLDLETGIETWTWNVPMLTPDRSKLLVSSFSLEDGVQMSGLQIYQTPAESVVKLLYEQEVPYPDEPLQYWSPKQTAWIANDSLIFQRVWRDTLGVEQMEYSLASVKRVYNAYEKYQIALDKLPLTRPHSNEEAMRIFRDKIDKNSTVYNDSSLMEFMLFQSELIDRLNEEARTSDSLRAALNRLNPRNKEAGRQVHAYGLYLQFSGDSVSFSTDPQVIANLFFPYISQSAQDFLNQWSADRVSAFVDYSSGKLLVRPQEIAERIVRWEHYMLKYPKSVFFSEAKAHASSYLYLLLFGTENSMPYKEKSMKYRVDFLDAYQYLENQASDSLFAKQTAKELLILLMTHKNKMNEQVMKFLEGKSEELEK
ncbi:MAG: hypothetical protein MI784_01625 [Cytophagales bacterium]|nr:hypothetical protein [Cytophagales bacterium]